MILQDYDIEDGDRVGLRYENPALSDKEFEDVVKNTQLSQPQEMQVEGLQEFSRINNLHSLSPGKYLLGGHEKIGTLDSTGQGLRIENVVRLKGLEKVQGSLCSHSPQCSQDGQIHLCAQGRG